MASTLPQHPNAAHTQQAAFAEGFAMRSVDATQVSPLFDVRGFCSLCSRHAFARRGHDGLGVSWYNVISPPHRDLNRDESLVLGNGRSLVHVPQVLCASDLC